jgi:hypothetical protein
MQSSPEQPLKAATRAVGAACVAIGVFHFMATTAWVSALLVISFGALLVQLGSLESHAARGCCSGPGVLDALREDMRVRPEEPTLACCGCGFSSGCRSYIDTARNVAIATIVFAFAEWLVEFTTALVVAIHAYKPKNFDQHSAELRGIRYAMWVAGSVTSAGFVHIVLAILALQMLQSLRVFARINPTVLNVRTVPNTPLVQASGPPGPTAGAAFEFVSTDKGGASYYPAYAGYAAGGYGAQAQMYPGRASGPAVSNIAVNA